MSGRAASAAYDTAMASLIGCKGLFAPPLTERKLALLRERLLGGVDSLTAALTLVDQTEAEAPFIAVAPPPPPAEAGEDARATEGASRRNVVSLFGAAR